MHAISLAQLRRSVNRSDRLIIVSRHVRYGDSAVTCRSATETKSNHALTALSRRAHARRTGQLTTINAVK